jgi:hypothetical protein
MARIDRLAAGTRRLAAAVIRRRRIRSCCSGGLSRPTGGRRLVGSGAESLRDPVTRAQYTFKHALTHVAYAVLPARRALHARIVDVLELAAGRPGGWSATRAPRSARRRGTRPSTSRAAPGSGAVPVGAPGRRRLVRRSDRRPARLPERRELLEQAWISASSCGTPSSLGQIEQDLSHLKAVSPSRALGNQRRLAWSPPTWPDFTLLGDQDRALELGKRSLDTDRSRRWTCGVLTQAYPVPSITLGNYRLGEPLPTQPCLLGERPHRHLGLPGRRRCSVAAGWSGPWPRRVRRGRPTATGVPRGWWTNRCLGRA